MKSKKGSEEAIDNLNQYVKALIDEAKSSISSSPKTRHLKSQIRSTINELETALNDLDPIGQPTSLFDPSNPKVVGRFVSLALVAQPKMLLKNIKRFYGSGVYAIYYNGLNSLYTPISKSETPIYVGQASPNVANARTPMEQGEKLSTRLLEHQKNIVKATTTLSIDEFEYRVLAVQSGWESAAEDYLIHLFKPIWNNETNLVFGLGKHGDNAKTRSNKRSPWDTVHQGRTWAADSSLQDAKTIERIKTELHEHFNIQTIFPDLESVLQSFLEELSQI